MDSSASRSSGTKDKKEIIFCKYCWKKCFSTGDFFLHWKEAHLKATWKEFARTSSDLTSAVFTPNPLSLNLAGKSYEVFASSGPNFWENYEEDASNDERGEWISLEELCAEINIETALSLPSPATNEDEYTYDRTCTENNTFPCVKCRLQFESTDSLLAHRVECLIKIGNMKLVKSISEVSGYEVVNDVTGHETSPDLITEIPLSSASELNENLVEEMPSSSKGKGKKFKCHFPGCSKKYKETSKLLEHDFRHSGVLSFPCSDCPVAFRKNRYLENHRKECGKGVKEARIEKEAPTLSTSIRPNTIAEIGEEPETNHSVPVSMVETETLTQNICVVEPDAIATDSNLPATPQVLETTLISPPNTPPREQENQNLPSIITDPTKVHPPNIDSGEPRTRTPSKFSRLTRELAALKRDNDTYDKFPQFEVSKPVRQLAEKSDEVIPPHRKGIYPCPYCQRQLSRPRDLEDHLRTHTGERPFSCQLCSASYVSLRALYTHRKWRCKVRRSKNITMEQVRKEAEQMNSLNSTHSNLENGNFDVQNPLDNQFNHPTEITISSTPRRRRKIGRPSEKRYQCLRCGKRFFTLTEKTQHRSVPCKRNQGWTTKGRSEYICLLCGKELSNSTNLENHTRTHTKEKPFKCSICQRGFVSENTRYKHQLSCRTGGVLNNEQEDSVENWRGFSTTYEDMEQNTMEGNEIPFVDMETEIEIEYNTSSFHSDSETEGLDGSESSSDPLQLNSTPSQYAKIGLSQHYQRNSSCDPAKLVQHTRKETNLPTTSKLLPQTNYPVVSTMAMPPPTTQCIIVTTGEIPDINVCPFCTGHMKFVGTKDELKDHIRAKHLD